MTRNINNKLSHSFSSQILMTFLQELYKYFHTLPVVISDDLIAAGDHEGWNDLTYAAAAVACGQAIDVPESILNVSTLSSPSIPEIEATGDHAASI